MLTNPFTQWEPYHSKRRGGKDRGEEVVDGLPKRSRKNESSKQNEI
jgi:hypothetical protein